MPANEVVRIMCPKLTCRRVLAVPTSARGKIVRCRTCGMNIKVPMGKDASGAAPVEAPAAKKAA
jgi:hypothetical protein